MDLSADGSVVVGFAEGDYQDGFRWSRLDGMQLMPRPPIHLGSRANAVSGDGRWVVGSGGPSAVRWEPGQPLEYLTDTVPPVTEALDVSRDGSVVVGYYNTDEGYNAFRWTPFAGFQFLKSPTLGAAVARAASADGSVIAGSAASADPGEAFVWDALNGMRPLGVLPGMTHSTAMGISDDGNVVVGYSYNTHTEVMEAFRWSDDGGMVGLGHPLESERQRSGAFGASADGSIIVGQAYTGAFIWTADTGARDLRSILSDELNLGEVAGWHLFAANAISDDGIVVVGTGFNPEGEQEAWIAVLPEPAVSWVVGTVAISLLRHPRRRRPSR